MKILFKSKSETAFNAVSLNTRNCLYTFPVHNTGLIITGKIYKSFYFLEGKIPLVKIFPVVSYSEKIQYTPSSLIESIQLRTKGEESSIHIDENNGKNYPLFCNTIFYGINSFAELFLFWKKKGVNICLPLEETINAQSNLFGLENIY